MDLEREQLARAGESDLADAVRWVAREDGDGLGYDIRSFRPTGAAETHRGQDDEPTVRSHRSTSPDGRSMSPDSIPSPTPCSGCTASPRDPRIYVLDGSVRGAARLEPSVFLGLPS